MVLGPILEKHLHADNCTSTNDEIWKIFDDTQDRQTLEGLYFTADQQDTGRGHGDNIWHSSPGSNILMSLLLQPISLKPIFQFDILRFISMALLDFLKKILPSHFQVQIKWPNDILVDGRKICGILIEHRIMDNSIAASVIGIGLNINETKFPDHISNATSLRLLFSAHIDKDAVFKKLIDHLRRSNRDLALKDLDFLHERYDRDLYGLSKKMLFKASGEAFTGIILGTDHTGLLRMQINNHERYFGFKEVSYIS